LILNPKANLREDSKANPKANQDVNPKANQEVNKNIQTAHCDKKP
jgi:hypothetical protein